MVNLNFSPRPGWVTQSDKVAGGRPLAIVAAIAALTGAFFVRQGTVWAGPPDLTPLANSSNSVAAGDSHVLVVKADGTAWAWGNDACGQLGKDPGGPGRVGSSSPARVLNEPGTGDFTSVAGGYCHSLGLKSNGTVWAWGANGGGALGNGSTVDNSSRPLQVRDASGTNFLTNIVKIAAGNTSLVGDPTTRNGVHFLALDRDGKVWAWSDNQAGQLGDGTTTNRSLPVQVQDPADGTGFLNNVVAVAAGDSASYALKANGTVWAWGDNQKGQLGDGATTNRLLPGQVRDASGGFLTNISEVAAGKGYVLALKADGAVWAWGGNQSGALGDGTTISRLLPARVLAPSGSGFLTNVTDLSAGRFGSSHSLALTADGAVWAWGNNNKGQLGDGTTTSRSRPVQAGIGVVKDVTAIAAETLKSVAVRSDGTVLAWGASDAPFLSGQPAPPSPVQITSVGQPDGQTNPSAGVPAVTWVDPPVATSTFNPTVTLTGFNIAGATAVHFGANPASDIKIVSTNQISVSAPAGAGEVVVTVTTRLGTSGNRATGHNRFIYPSPPSAPLNLSATAGDRRVDLTWSPPLSDGGSPITGYKITGSPGGTAIAGPEALSATVTGLTNRTPYTFRIVATNAFGDGSPSAPSNETVPSGVAVPGAAANVAAVSGNQSASVSWTPPGSDGGAAIASYTVTSTPGGHTSIVTGSPPATSTQVAGLSNGTAYTFTVSAANSAGAGPNSESSNSVVPSTVPDVPTEVLAAKGDASARISWTAPSDNGSPISSYRVESSPGGHGVNVTGTPPATSADVTGLTNGTAYVFVVTAANSNGPGPTSNPSNSVVPSTVPGLPLNVSAAAGDSSATVSWNPPQSDGGSPIASYRIRSNPEGETKTLTGSPPATTATIEGLSNGTAYTFTVEAANANGAGPASAPSNAVTPKLPPAPSASVSPGYLDFGEQPTGTTGNPKRVRLTNMGDSDLSVDEISTGGEFIQTNDCPVKLSPQADCSIEVKFQPASAGAKAGKLTVASNDPAGGQTVDLSGTGKVTAGQQSGAGDTGPGHAGSGRRNSGSQTLPADPKQASTGASEGKASVPERTGGKSVPETLGRAIVPGFQAQRHPLPSALGGGSSGMVTPAPVVFPKPDVVLQKDRGGSREAPFEKSRPAGRSSPVGWFLLTLLVAVASAWFIGPQRAVGLIKSIRSSKRVHPDPR